MLFPSYVFLFAFLPIVLTGYFLLAKLKSPVYQRMFLVLASLYFYGYFNWYYLFIIIASIIGNFILAQVMDHTDDKPVIRKAAFVLGILYNVGLLGYFKYYDFFIENVNAVFGTSFMLRHILLPLGISFFTFQQLSFIIAVYKKTEKISNFLDYSLFVTFFPQLIAGPIVEYGEMMPQFLDPANRRVNPDNIAKGAYLFAMGLFKKLVIADTISAFVTFGLTAPSDTLTSSVAWLTVLLGEAQVYFDFSGYSDMAIGLGKMFNVDIPVNFFSPFKSESIMVFWTRWNITLGRALRNYIYIPLGGNRKGKHRKAFNLFAVFFISGLWHGASWAYVLWGVAHGVMVVIELYTQGILKKIPKALRVAGTFVLSSIAAILIIAPSLKQAVGVFKALFKFDMFRPEWFSSIGFMAEDGIIGFPNAVNTAYLLAVFAIVMLIIFIPKNAIERYNKFTPDKKNLAMTVAMFVFSVLHLSKDTIFIYFNF
ncbi:MAG: MBOAT family protein [Clostridia bacterium]|nr:MBOAT family protein [Clostridia bacterium]